MSAAHASRAARAAALALALAALVALLLGLRAAPLSVVVSPADPAADAYLTGFRGLEESGGVAYRWSFPAASVDLRALARAPLIADLRATSPRPADEPPADMGLGRGAWQAPRFPVRGDWRRYQVLVPAAGYQPELTLPSTAFRPDERDRRSLGVALSRVRLTVPDTLGPLPWLAIAGPWRLALLLALPPAAFALALAALRGRRGAAALAALPGAACLAIVYRAAADPLGAWPVPEGWLAPALAALAALLWLAWRPSLAPAERAASRALADDRARALAVAGAALAIGVVMLAAVPPWEHPDEASHFEFAWLIANRPGWPTPGTSDPRIAAIGGGGRALFHQPLYHILVSLALRLAGGLDLTAQLYVARCVSLALFVAVALMAERTARELLPPGSPLRWLAPLALVLNPTFAALMTGVNNDAAAVAACVWGTLGAAATLMRGLSWRRAAWLAASVPLAMLCKNTGTASLAVAAAAVGAAVWAGRGWRWRWLAAGAALGAAALAAAALTGGDPASWYRWGASTGGPAAQVERPDAPAGGHALRLAAQPVRGYEGLSAPTAPTGELSGKRVTVGAWVWASRPAHIWAPGVIYRERDDNLHADFREIDVGTEPRFVAFEYQLPPRLTMVHLMAWSVAPDDPAPLEIYYDGAVLAAGSFASEPPPQLEPGAGGGVWGGRPFRNLIRNGDVERGWVRLRPQAEQLIARYARRSPARAVASLADADVALRLELRDYMPWMVFTSFGAYGGRMFLRGEVWQYLLPGFALAALAGMAGGAARLGREDPRRRVALGALALATVAVWAAILAAHLPVNFPGGIPSARYGFTVMLPTTLFIAAGWLALWPARMRGPAAALMLLGMLVLDVAAVDSIRLFASTSCAVDPTRCAFSGAPSLLESPAALLGLLPLLPLAAAWAWRAARRTPPAAAEAYDRKS